MSDKEQFTCFECALAGREAQVELDTNGRCGVCHSDAVLSAHQVQQVVANPTATQVTQQQVRTRIVEQVREARKYYYLLDSSGAFETVVSWQDAPNADAAVAYAYDPTKNHPWYRTEAFFVFLGRENKTLSHSEYCDWLRKH